MFSRIFAISTALTMLGALIPLTASAQSHDGHGGHGGHGGDGHAHMGPTVSCENMATPPWAGLSQSDQQRFSKLRSNLNSIDTPESAKAAGYFPALGDIPGMGVHYVNMAMGLGTDFDVDVPNQLMFSEVDGEDKLVGAAYAFVDVTDTQVALPFESEYASWHDHPQFAKDGETLHMLHVWFVESSNGPFAGLNFWLPYETAGIQIPNPCWMAGETTADKIRKVSFALTQMNMAKEAGIEAQANGQSDAPAAADIENFSDTTGLDEEVVEAIVSETDGTSGASWNRPEPLSAERIEMIAALNVAALDDNEGAWNSAADTILADLSQDEMNMVLGTLGILGENQMSSAERDAAGIAQPGSSRGR